MLRHLIPGLLGVLAADGAAGAQRPALSIDAALSLRSVSALTLSPDGTRVVYRMERPRAAEEARGGAVGELWSVASSGGPALRIADAGFDAGSPQWSPDGTRVAWISSWQAGDAKQVFVRGADGGPIATVTRAPGGIEAFAWSPDGSRLAFTAWDAQSPQRARERQLGHDWTVFDSAGAQLRLYTVELASGETVLVTHGEMSVHALDWSPDGRRFAIGAAPTASDDHRELGVQVYVVDAAGGAPRLIAPLRGRVSHPIWSADGRSVAWLGSIDATDPWAGSVFIAPADGSAAPRNLTPELVGTATWLGRLPGQPRKLVFRSEEYQAVTLRTVDLESGQAGTLAMPPVVLDGGPAFSRDGRSFASIADSATHPPEVFIGTSARPREIRRITHSNPVLHDTSLGAQEVVRWKSKDGLEIQGILLKPVDYREGQRYPVVVHVHGGSESVVSNGWLAQYDDFGQVLAGRGFAVIYPNYRGSRGRGTSFVRGNRRDLMGREWEDIESALDHLVSEGIADADRAGIYGFSWGGYAAGWGATRASHRFKAAVAGGGIYNWISVAGSNNTRLHEQIAHWDEPLYENFSFYLQRSPLHEIRKANTPLLMLHGELDTACPLGQAIEMHTALKWKGTPVELVIYPREGHGMVELAHQRDFMKRGIEWLEKYLR